LKGEVIKAQAHPTKRAPDWWDSPRFQAVFWLEAGSGKAALSRPAHQRVTQAVRHTNAFSGFGFSL